MPRIAITLLLLIPLVAPAVATLPPQAHRLPAEDRPLAADFTDAFVIGRETGADHEMLFDLVDIAFGPDGRLFVLEEDGRRVLVHGPDGEFERAFGREGEGPGEFRLPFSIAVTAADEVVVWDFLRSAHLVFEPDGTHIRDVVRSDRSLHPSRDSLAAWPGGGVVHLPTRLQREGDPPEDVDRGAVIHDLLDPDVVPRPLLEVRHPRRRSRTVAGVMSLHQGPELGPRARWDVLSDGRLAVVDGVPYRIRLVDPASGETTVIERPIPPRPVTEAERNEILAERREGMENPAGVAISGGGGGRGQSPSEIDARLEAIEFADRVPVVKDLAVDRADRLWVQRHGESALSAEGPVDVVTAQGEYLGTLPPMRLPDAFGPEGLVAWMETGEDVEVERVVVKRLPAELRR